MDNAEQNNNIICEARDDIKFQIIKLETRLSKENSVEAQPENNQSENHQAPN